jgi:hypothetical protein
MTASQLLLVFGMAFTDGLLDFDIPFTDLLFTFPCCSWNPIFHSLRGFRFSAWCNTSVMLPVSEIAIRLSTFPCADFPVSDITPLCCYNNIHGHCNVNMALFDMAL